jgi:hypothetical protein
MTFVHRCSPWSNSLVDAQHWKVLCVQYERQENYLGIM